MKQTIYLCIVAALFAFGLTGCSDDRNAAAVEHNEPAANATSQAEGAQAPAAGRAQADLMHRHFVLRSVNGLDYSQKERVPSLEFTEGFRVSGGMCNRYTGQAELDGGKLYVKQMASTKMLCADEDLNKLEYAFAQMLGAGADMAFDGKTLTLKGGDLDMVFDLRDWVK